ncbi:MAG: hypothetical protein ABJE66_03105 [Deltaproteobacteria bacterium]
MRTIAIVVGLSLGTSMTAFASDDRGAPMGPTETETLRGNVLVWQDATFYVEGRDDAATLHVASLAGARKDSPGVVIPMHVVATTHDFVEVEAAASGDCAGGKLETSDDLAKLHLFVKRAALAPVLVQPYARTFENGTKIALRPGIALIPAAAEGKFIAAVTGGTVTLELPATSVGHAYSPDKSHAPIAVSEHEYEIAPKTSLMLGDMPVALAGQRAIGTEPHGTSTLLSFRSRCTSLDLLAPAKAVHPFDDDDDASLAMGGSGGVLALREHDYIPAGTPLATPGGHPIAAAAKPIYLSAPPHGKTACVDRHVHVDGDALAPTDGDDRIRVCAPASRVVHERWRSSGSANGATGR